VASEQLGMSVLSLEVTLRESSSFPTAAVAGGIASGVAVLLAACCGMALFLRPTTKATAQTKPTREAEAGC